MRKGLINQYELELDKAAEEGEMARDRDFDRLAELFKDDLYSWWD